MFDNPVFIVGSARSGTVFVGEVLKSHSEVHCLIERPDVFDHASFLALNPSVKKQQPEQIRDQLRELYSNAWAITAENCRTCSSICRKSGDKSRLPWVRTCQSKRSVKRYADKSHQHVLNVEILLEAFPQAQFIHIIRDGRDVVSSMLRHSGVLSWFSDTYINENSEWPHPWFGVEDIDHFRAWSQWSMAEKCALRWTSWVAAGLEASKTVPKSQWLDINYETLMRQPLQTGASIFSFIGLDLDKKARAKLQESHVASVDAWKRRLNKEQQDQVLHIIRGTMTKLGYSI